MGQVGERMKKNWKKIGPRFSLFMWAFLLVTLFLVGVFFDRIFISIGSGEQGVRWRRFAGGTELDRIYGEGFFILPPWDKMEIYDVRVQQVAHQFTALSNDGLLIDFDLSIRFYPNRKEITHLHKEVGPDYVDKLLKPEVQAQTRKIIGSFRPDDIYGSEEMIVELIREGSISELSERYVVVDDLLLKTVRLPERVRASIENKLREEQKSLEYEFRLVREERESERKQIEASGIRDFLKIVSEDNLFYDYLTFRGIDATLELAKSENSKIVIFGGGGEGSKSLPLILNLSDGVSPSQHQKKSGKGADTVDLPASDAMPIENVFPKESTGR